LAFRCCYCRFKSFCKNLGFGRERTLLN